MSEAISKPEIEQLKEGLRKELRKEFTTKVAGWIVAGAALIFALAGLGAWTLLKPTIAADLSPLIEQDLAIPDDSQIRNIAKQELAGFFTQDEIARLAKTLVAHHRDALRGEPGTSPDVAAVADFIIANHSDQVGPKGEGTVGIVVAATKACSDLQPENAWEEYTEARGRVILGANPWGSHGYLARPFESTGGAEKHVLKKDEIPQHTHGGHIVDRQTIGGNDRLVVLKSTLGSRPNDEVTAGSYGHSDTQGHDIMQPYIALYFCQRK